MRVVLDTNILLLHIWKKLTNLRPFVSSLMFYIFAAICDWSSTEYAKHQHIDGLIEQNVFARGPDYQVVLHKALVMDSIGLFVLLLTALAIYNSGKQYNKKLAELAACAPFVYIGFDRLYNAALENVLFGLHFYVPRIETISIFGKLIHLVR